MRQTDEQRSAVNRQGDREAFSVVVREHLGRVYALCFGILGDPAESEDLAQLAGWIGQIARNLCRDHLRRARAQLPEQHRVPLMLFYFDGQSTVRLAEALGLSPAGACTRLSRARRELRKLMGEEDNRP